jgi:hypothetical protein
MIVEAFIHNDEVTCFHVAIQGTQKVIMMGHHNFKDSELSKRRWATQKINKIGKKLMDENKQGNYRKLFLFAT